MNEMENKGIILVIGIMTAVAIAGFILVSFLNKDYQAYLAEKPAEIQSQQIQNPDVSAQENQKLAGKAESTIDVCVDFDGGKDYYKKGTTRIGNSQNINEDYCGSEETLIEFYCNNKGGISEEFYNCQNGCNNGACLKSICGNNVCDYGEDVVSCSTDCPKSTCIDSDGGADIYLKGTATSNAPPPYYQNQTDSCLDAWSCEQHFGKGASCVNEAICHNDGIIGMSAYNCPNGCTDGACISQDSNSGKG